MASLECQENYIYNTDGSVDVLIFGSSRTMQGVDPSIVADEMGEGVKAVNLARSWRGNGQIFHMARDFIESHKVNQAIVLELSFFSYNDRSSRVYANGYYPNYQLVTRSNDFKMDFNSAHRQPYYLRVRDFLSNYLELIDTRLNRLFEKNYMKGWSLFEPYQSHEIMEVETGGCFVKDNKIKANVLEDKVKKTEKKFGVWEDSPNDGWNLDAINNDRPSFYIDMLKELAAENDIQLILIQVPSYYEAATATEFNQSVETKYGVKYLTPDNNLRGQIFDNDGFTDISHMSVNGREIYSRWLADQISELVKGTGY